MFFFEIISFLIVWPFVWWLGGRLAHDDGAPVSRDREASGPDNVVDLQAWKARQASRQRLHSVRSRNR
jgi:hypothetical protein